MAHRPSNAQRNRWVVSLLDVQPTDRVLEIGFGPGIAIQELSWSATAELPGFGDVTVSAIRSGTYPTTTDLRDRQAGFAITDRLSVRQRREIRRMRGPRAFGPP
jgi:hypothetical protein